MATPMTVSQFCKRFFYSQFFVRIAPPTSDFTGQTIIVTGSNTGIGFEAARHLLRLNTSKVILAVRDLAKGEAAAEALLKSTAATENTLEVWPLDLSDLDSIKTFAERANTLERLDAVIQNAGILNWEWNMVNGMEAHIAINVVHTTLLGLLLLPKLRESAKKHNAQGRMTFVSSDRQYTAHVNEANAPGSLFEALNNKDIAVITDRYPTSKLFQIYAVREIAARAPVTPDSNVIVNAMTPGMCQSTLVRGGPWWFPIVAPVIYTVLARSSATGGATLVDAVRPDLSLEHHGAYLQDCQIAENGPNVESAEAQALAKRFIEELFQKLEQLSPGVMEVLH